MSGWPCGMSVWTVLSSVKTWAKVCNLIFSFVIFSASTPSGTRTTSIDVSFNWTKPWGAWPHWKGWNLTAWPCRTTTATSVKFLNIWIQLYSLIHRHSKKCYLKYRIFPKRLIMRITFEWDVSVTHQKWLHLNHCLAWLNLLFLLVFTPTALSGRRCYFSCWSWHNSITGLTGNGVLKWASINIDSLQFFARDTE